MLFKLNSLSSADQNVTMKHSPCTNRGNGHSPKLQKGIKRKLKECYLNLTTCVSASDRRVSAEKKKTLLLFFFPFLPFSLPFPFPSLLFSCTPLGMKGVDWSKDWGQNFSLSSSLDNQVPPHQKQTQMKDIPRLCGASIHDFLKE